ncbi:hypothetical protein M885DRAFT_521060 [Pelagophyceae sp. CCMP2097]|nr:hypothetical protein M885DRAFT_521060 [Pelagophyceae sp. CCMP2097]
MRFGDRCLAWTLRFIVASGSRRYARRFRGACLPRAAEMTSSKARSSTPARANAAAV